MFLVQFLQNRAQNPLNKCMIFTAELEKKVNANQGS